MIARIYIYKLPFAVASLPHDRPRPLYVLRPSPFYTAPTTVGPWSRSLRVFPARLVSTENSCSPSRPITNAIITLVVGFLEYVEMSNVLPAAIRNFSVKKFLFYHVFVSLYATMISADNNGYVKRLNFRERDVFFFSVTFLYGGD